MSDKLKNVASKLDEIENNICELKNHIKSVIDYVQAYCSQDDIEQEIDESESYNGENDND